MKKIAAVLGVTSIVGIAAATPQAVKVVNKNVNNKESNSINQDQKIIIKFSDVRNEISKISKHVYENFDQAKQAFDELKSDLYTVKTEINQASLVENTKANGYYVCDISLTPTIQATWEDGTSEAIKFTTTVNVDERSSFSEEEVKAIITQHLGQSFLKEAPKTIAETKKAILKTSSQLQNYELSQGLIINKVSNKELTEQDQNLPVNEIVEFEIAVSLKNGYKWSDTQDGSLKIIAIEQRVDGRANIDFNSEVETIKQMILEKSYMSVEEFEQWVPTFKNQEANGISFAVDKTSENNTSEPIWLVDSTITASIDSKKYRWLNEPDNNEAKSFNLNSIKIDNREETSYKEVKESLDKFILENANKYNSLAEMYKALNEELSLADKGAVITSLEYDQQTHQLNVSVALDRMFKWSEAEENLNGKTKIAKFTISDVSFINKILDLEQLNEEFKNYMQDMTNINTNADIENKAKAFLDSSELKDKVEIVENSITIDGDIETESGVIVIIEFVLKEGYTWANGTASNTHVPLSVILEK
ncbi:hypothetical protein [Mesoplasma seiffertii]|uniref:hypothetical protein n=1 Tax=Mesoplasma seiffertii TaxID=28224 RepID=UPI00047D9AC0|nr:hypothetical protein [Mesoplasma seiffertii]